MYGFEISRRYLEHKNFVIVTKIQDLWSTPNRLTVAYNLSGHSTPLGWKVQNVTKRSIILFVLPKKGDIIPNHVLVEQLYLVWILSVSLTSGTS